MPSTAASLASLVQSIDATAREDTRRRKELIEDCEAILESHIGREKEADLSTIANAVRKQLLQQPGGSNLSLRFSNLVSRLADQPVLSRKPALLLFLQSLAFTPASNGASSIPALITSLVPPSRSAPSRSPSPLLPPNSPITLLSKGKTKADILKEYRAKIGKPHIPEYLLLRDTLYLLQGISGKYVRFSDGDDDRDHRIIFVEDREYLIPAPTKALIHKLAELGHLYARVAAFVEERDGLSSVGMIEQSLCHHLHTQLTEYYRLVAILESQMSDSAKDTSSETPAASEFGLTLRRLDVWIDDWRLRMRMMSVCVENCKDAKGGALVSLIHANTNNGDPFVRGFTDQLLEDVSKPFFDTLQKWLFTGDLHDPYSEFFVGANAALADVQYTSPAATLSGDGGFESGSGVLTGERNGGVDGQHLWENKFIFRKEMLPSFVSEDFGRKIFSTGKSLNFIRYSCHDSDWVATRSKLTNVALKYSDIAGLERSIDTAYRVASQRLFEIFFNKFHLIEHLNALKGYLMLGRGDFADHLMESLAPSLARPAHTLALHHLTAPLEAAIRYSNEDHDQANVLRRLDARVLSVSEGEIGWEVFTLEYKVDAPIDTVLGPDSMIGYQRLFNHLWKMKRVESVLAAGWMRIASATKTFFKTIPEYQPLWHHISISMAEMNHFVRQMQAYSQLEVIACRWKVLMEFAAKKEGDLDALIGAHTSYLDQVVNKVLLLHPTPKKETVLLVQVRESFKRIVDFNDSLDHFYNHCLNESARRDAEKDIARGVITGDNRRQDDPKIIHNTFTRLQETSADFAEGVQALVTGLHTHPDQDCRFLAVRLSFSEYYRPTRKESAHQSSQLV